MVILIGWCKFRFLIIWLKSLWFLVVFRLVMVVFKILILFVFNLVVKLMVVWLLN